MQLDDAPCNGKTETRVAVSGSLTRRLVKGFEYSRQVTLRDAFAGVGDAQNYLLRIAAHGNTHGPAGRCVGEGVVDEIVEHALHQRDIRGNQGQIRIQLHGQRDLALAGLELELLHHVLNQLG